MSTRLFCQKLAVERCQQHLAQLSALTFLEDNDNSNECNLHYQTIYTLIGSLNRDLALISETVDIAVADVGDQDPADGDDAGLTVHSGYGQ